MEVFSWLLRLSWKSSPGSKHRLTHGTAHTPVHKLHAAHQVRRNPARIFVPDQNRAGRAFGARTVGNLPEFFPAHAERNVPLIAHVAVIAVLAQHNARHAALFADVAQHHKIVVHERLDFLPVLRFLAEIISAVNLLADNALQPFLLHGFKKGCPMSQKVRRNREAPAALS